MSRFPTFDANSNDKKEKPAADHFLVPAVVFPGGASHPCHRHQPSGSPDGPAAGSAEVLAVGECLLSLCRLFLGFSAFLPKLFTVPPAAAAAGAAAL